MARFVHNTAHRWVTHTGGSSQAASEDTGYFGFGLRVQHPRPRLDVSLRYDEVLFPDPGLWLCLQYRAPITMALVWRRRLGKVCKKWIKWLLNEWADLPVGGIESGRGGGEGESVLRSDRPRLFLVWLTSASSSIRHFCLEGIIIVLQIIAQLSCVTHLA